MPRANSDARWITISTGEYDDEGYEYSDYILDGSEPLTPFEAMVLASADVSICPDLNPFLTFS